MNTDYSRYDYYQKTNVWPTRMDDLNYKGWLDNFTGIQERKLAQLILDYFVYIPEDMVNQLFKTVVGKAGFHFRKTDPAWNNNSFKNDCWYSYIPGEVPNISDSGGIFARKVKEVLNVDENRILRFEDLVKELKSNSTPQRVILTDDFVGSGNQCSVAWNSDVIFDDIEESLKSVVLAGRHQVIYAPLIVNKIGAERIAKECDGLILECVYRLEDDCNLFSPNCPCWKGKRDIFEAGTEMILNISKEQGIFDNAGTQSVRGYKNQGLALAFSHGMPDACPAFFYWQNDNWLPLMKKHFKRM